MLPPYQGRYLTEVFIGNTATPFFFGPGYNKHWKVLIASFFAGATLGGGEFIFWFVSDSATNASPEGSERMPITAAFLYPVGTMVPLVGGGTNQPPVPGYIPYIYPNNVRELYVRYPQSLAVTINGLNVDVRSELKMLVLEDDQDKALCLPT